MYTKLFSVLCVSFLLLGESCMGLEQIKVTGNRVNVRAIADLQGEIVGQVSRGDVLFATGERKGGMIAIVPPVSISVWVYSELIRDGVVAVSSVIVRSGPGIGFRSVGKISKGYEVEPLGTKGDWLKISPPPSCTVWISEKFVRGSAKENSVVVADTHPVVIEPPDAASVEPIITDSGNSNEQSPPVVIKDQSYTGVNPPPQPINALRKPKELVIKPPAPIIWEPLIIDGNHVESIKPVVSDSNRENADVIGKLKLVSCAPQGKAIVVTGKIIRAGFFPLRRPSKYRLLISEAGSPEKTGCYLVGDNDRLADYSGHIVRIVGEKYWVQGVREPVVLVSEFCKPE